MTLILLAFLSHIFSPFLMSQQWRKVINSRRFWRNQEERNWWKYTKIELWIGKGTRNWEPLQICRQVLKWVGETRNFLPFKLLKFCTPRGTASLRYLKFEFYHLLNNVTKTTVSIFRETSSFFSIWTLTQKSPQKYFLSIKYFGINLTKKI